MQNCQAFFQDFLQSFAPIFVQNIDFIGGQLSIFQGHIPPRTRRGGSKPPETPDFCKHPDERTRPGAKRPRLSLWESWQPERADLSARRRNASEQPPQAALSESQRECTALVSMHRNLLNRRGGSKPPATPDFSKHPVERPRQREAKSLPYGGRCKNTGIYHSTYGTPSEMEQGGCAPGNLLHTFNKTLVFPPLQSPYT